MPIENRSSNTEMAAQLSPCPHCGQQDAFVEQLDSDASVVICQGRIDEYSVCLARGPVGVQQHECEDQPGHDQAVKEWNKRAAAAPHPDPIAWMVGTAFWWTKEEAERDAAETGLPIVGLGPMVGPRPVEQLQGELVAAFKNCIYARAYIADLFKQRLRRHDFNQYITERLAGDFAYALANWLAAEGQAHPAEVERLREELDLMKISFDRNFDAAQEAKAERDTLRAKLVERDALMADISKRHWSGVDFDLPADLVDRIRALSASAEPRAPVEPSADEVRQQHYDEFMQRRETRAALERKP